MNKSINCCSVTDSNYIRPTSVTVASICKNNYDVVVNYFIVLNGIEITDKRLSCLLQLTNKYKNLVIRLIPVNSENLIPLDIQEKIGKTLISSRLTLSVYLRLFLAEILPTTIDRVLYLDSDVLCLGGVLPLYTANLDGIPLLGVEDIQSVKHTKRLNLSAYINSGVLLINLKYWRDKGVMLGDKVISPKRQTDPLSKKKGNCMKRCKSRIIGSLNNGRPNPMITILEINQTIFVPGWGPD